MKITFCLKTANHSGGNKVVAQYAERLARRGHEVTIVVGPEPTPRLRRRLRETVRAVIARRALPRYERFPASPLDQLPGVRVHRVNKARPFVNDDFPSADVVVATWWETAEWVAQLAPSKGAKAYFIQGLESTIDGMPEARVEATLSLPLHPITIANFLVQHLIEKHSARDVSYVPNAIDLKHFDAPAREKQKTPTVACIYTGDLRIKGFDITLAALREVHREMPNLRVVCFGNGAPPDGLLPPYFAFTQRPPQHAIPSLYASADVFAHGSRIEGFGLPILEAMACHTPVVSTPSGAAPELLAEGRGHVLASLDPSEMTQAILDVLRASDDAWRDLSKRAHAYAHAYSLDAATLRFEAALRAVIDAG